jgi:uncharacterized protein
MASPTGSRSDYFPAIEAKYGQPMAYWIGLLEDRAQEGYPAQMAFLQEEHGFSRAHANALVMYCRGSESSKRFNSTSEYLATLDPVAATTMRAIFAAITEAHPEFELVMAWNQPMLRQGDDYVFGASVQSKHVLLGPWARDTVSILAAQLTGYTVNKKTVKVPLDWDVDTALLLAMVDLRLAELH